MVCCCWKRGLIFIVVSGALLAALIARFTPSAEPLFLPTNTYWGPKVVPQAQVPLTNSWYNEVGIKVSSLEFAERVRMALGKNYLHENPLQVEFVIRGSAAPKDDESIQKFTVEYPTDMIAKLREDIKNSVWVEPLENAAYHYGVNLKTFRDLMEYWRTKFDFNKSLAEINAYQNYKTEIEGLKIHFLRSKAKPKSANVKVIPLMLIHGWPGSFIEFLDVIPLLNEARDNIAFDVVVPSLPGFGFSDAPRRNGVDAVVSARILKKLMTRLGYSRYFVQGGDWGSAVTASMGTLYPEDVRGIHLNLLFNIPMSPWAISKIILLKVFPKYFSDGPLPECMGVAPKVKLQEFGYFHMQATKPDTLGLAHINSPVGLAAHILEKFAVATDRGFLDLEDGGFGRRIPIDRVLSNLMAYYASNSAISSYRFYKENMLSGNMFKFYKKPVTVPAGYSIFPNDINCLPTFIAKDLLSNLTSLTYQEVGGHFAAMEVPQAFVDDIRQFVKKSLSYTRRSDMPCQIKRSERKGIQSGQIYAEFPDFRALPVVPSSFVLYEEIDELIPWRGPSRSLQT